MENVSEILELKSKKIYGQDYKFLKANLRLEKHRRSKKKLVGLRVFNKAKPDYMGLRVELYTLKNANHVNLQKLIKVIETPKSVKTLILIF